MQAAQAAGIPRRILLGKDGLNAPQTTVAGTGRFSFPRNSSRRTRPLSLVCNAVKQTGRAAQKAALPFCLNFCARRAPYDVVPPPT